MLYYQGEDCSCWPEPHTKPLFVPQVMYSSFVKFLSSQTKDSLDKPYYWNFCNLFYNMWYFFTITAKILRVTATVFLYELVTDIWNAGIQHTIIFVFETTVYQSFLMCLFPPLCTGNHHNHSYTVLNLTSKR